MSVTSHTDPEVEAQRLQELREFDILDTPEEKEFNDLVELASGITGMPISLITLLDEERQWFKARVGFGLAETSRKIAFCDHTIRQDDPLVISDATLDERFRSNPLVTGASHIRFYAGFPLITPNGSKLGTLCVLDHKPGILSAEKQSMLSKLADKVVQILELRRRNKELAELKQAADHQRDTMDQLVDNQRKMMSILAHDTKGPLTSMAHLVDMMAEARPLEESMKDMALSLMSGQLKVTLDLIDNLIAWGGTHISAQLYEETPYKPAQVAQEAFQPLARMAEEKGISFIVSEEPGTMYLVNKEVLRFIIRNLLHNAIKFTESGSVRATLRKEGECSEVCVADTGIGMPKGTQDKLFARKVPSREGTRKEPGSGLGLILVNDFVLKLGGEITVHSEEGKGSQITIRFAEHPGARCS